MKIEQIYTGCLAQGAYYIESKGEVAVIDPLRETKPYIERAEKKGDRIKYIFETHFHADFVSGHVSLAEKTGAEIIFGPTAETDFRATIAKDNQEFQLGDIADKLRAQAEANKRYNSALARAEAAFKAKDWAKASLEYTTASDLKPNEQLPKDKIKEDV